MSNYREFAGPGASGPLLNDVAQVKVRDHADQDVRRAMADVKANENRERLVDEVGAEGISSANEWLTHISQHGPKAALHAAQLYATQPKPAAPKEEQRNEGDHHSAARAAMHAVAEKERHAGDRHQARAGLDRLQSVWGSLEPLNDFKRWDEQLRANPQDAGPRIMNEIHQGLSDAVLNQQAHATLAEYDRRAGKADPETRQIMQELLAQGFAHDLESARREAEYERALDINDTIPGFTRAAAQAQRKLERPERANAKAIVSQWKQQYPQRVGTARYQRMENLLKNDRATDLDDAWEKAGRR